MELRLTFSDKDDDGSWEMQKAQRAVRADDAFSVLFELDQALRSRNKYYECMSEADNNFIDGLKESLSSEDHSKLIKLLDKIEEGDYNFVEELRLKIHNTGLLELYR